MSVCLLATARNRQKVGMSALVCILFFSLFIFYTNCVMPGPFCSLLSLSFFFLYSLQATQGENSDHHIVFDVTVNSRARVLSTFFSADKRVLSVHIRDYSSVGLGFFYLTCERRKRTGLSVLYTSLIGHC